MHMTKNKITLVKALALLEQNALNEAYEVDFVDSDSVAATDAIKLGILGIDVPEDRIYYDDIDLEDDEDFAGDWVRIDSDIADYKQHLTINLKVDDEIEAWLTASNIDLDSLVSELITGFYRSSKAIKD